MAIKSAGQVQFVSLAEIEWIEAADYYAALQVRRAGVSNSDEYLQDLSGAIAGLQGTPGRLVQTAEMASYDAWIKYFGMGCPPQCSVG